MYLVTYKWYPIRFSYHLVFVSFNNYTKDATSEAGAGAGTAYHYGAHDSTSFFKWGSCCPMFIIYVGFCWPLVFFLSFFGHCIVYVFELHLLITPSHPWHVQTFLTKYNNSKTHIRQTLNTSEYLRKTLYLTKANWIDFCLLLRTYRIAFWTCSIWRWFSLGTPVSSTNKTLYTISTIWLKYCWKWR